MDPTATTPVVSRALRGPLDTIVDTIKLSYGKTAQPLGIADPFTVAEPFTVAPSLRSGGCFNPARGADTSFGPSLNRASASGHDPGADSGGWIPAASLVNGSALPQLLEAPARRWNATPHAAAALAWKAYTYWLALPAVAGLVLADRAPLLDADNVLVRVTRQRPYLTIGVRRPKTVALPTDPHAGAPNVTVVEDRDALIAAVRSSLVDRHLAPLARATREQVRIGDRLLYGALAAAVGYALQRVGTLAPRHAVSTGAAILDALDLTDLAQVSHAEDGSVAMRRHTCCLAFTTPALDVCSSCCIKN